MYGLVSCSILGRSDSALMSRAVLLKGAQGLCSGVQVHARSGKDYILTAGHCAPIASNGKIEVIDEVGRHYVSRVIEESPDADLLLLEGIPGMRGLEIAKSESPHEHIRSFTHGRGLPTYETEGSIIDEQFAQFLISSVSSLEEAMACVSNPKQMLVPADGGFFCVLGLTSIITNLHVEPGSSGGMIVNDGGEIIGIVTGSGTYFSFIVPLKDIRSFLSNR